ncbi:MAG TPA: nitrate- and nitrite sensing domain-containing protein [Actinophytocola sp.]|uniref:sensor histidine kinase n=1 Tax=Actinophytocola sp. TaxID=1872138 RepID=UPI002DDD2302|nr:nitrate- and nitrite sensing domain-containing protein [Actinophytocola sp.]HEV2783563.1 nitrate- and nitrite sensing domain-containing protein [Actinophytocola sp.]
MSSVEDGASVPPGRRRAWWAAAVQWRNWPLLVKLGMVLVVPVVAAMVLGVLRVKADVELARSYADVERLATLRGGLVEVLSVIQRERKFAVQQPAGGSPTFKLQIDETDVITRDWQERARIAPDLGEAAARGYRELTGALSSLRTIRGDVTAGADALVVLGGYNAVTNALLEFDRTLVGQFPDRELSGISAALYDLQVAREQVSLQQAVGLAGLRRGALTDTERDMLIEAGIRLDDKLTEGRALAPPHLWQYYETTVTGPDVTSRRTLALAARASGTIAMPFSESEWNSVSDSTTILMTNVLRTTAAELQTASTALQSSVSNRAGTQSVLVVVMLLLVLGIGGVLGRYLLRSVGVLRRTALEVAHTRLPAAVASIRAGEAAKVAIEPVPLHTTEEFGQLARAFDAVNGQAVRSAAEEASLRNNLSNIFVNLSRRSQGLVERQLKLMEQLEQKENDPDQLANLFKLDHLATRMRRNNENLMVLSGIDLGRRASEPVPLPDVLRAAVSEIEHYQRAVVRSAPLSRIVGYAASDLIRLVAELVENATAFSPPTTQVVITSQLNEDGSVRIDIVDQGIGMGEAELHEANQRVAVGGGVDVPISRQMGLFVVGSLANRHGIQVRLSNRDDDEHGLRATVHVRRELVAMDLSETQPVPVLATPGAAARADGAAAVVDAAPARSGGVTGRLQLAGIVVQLPDLPAATSPASILFAARTPVEDNGAKSGPGQFTWLGDRAAARGSSGPARPAGPQGPPPPAAAHAKGPDGLPKRVPQAQLLGNPSRGVPAPAPPPPAPTRDPARARGFLSNFQAGIRQSENSKGEPNP